VQTLHTYSYSTRKRKYYRGTLAKNVGFRGLIETAEADFGDFRIEFLGESVFDMASVRDAMALWGEGGAL
jgi:hypothetical protein